MNITKYEHACLVLEEEGKKLVIDPGEYTSTFGPLEDIVAVVITHQHPDHFLAKHVQSIITANPEVQVFMPADTKAQFADEHAVAVTGGEEKLIHPFTLKFFGENHHVIEPSMTPINNVGVLVNDTLYYPGDSFTVPVTDAVIGALAVPASAPWFKMADAMEFIRAIRPRSCFMTHDALLSDIGRKSHSAWIEKTAAEAGAKFVDLLPGDNLDC